MKESFPIQGMHCASCANIITNKVGKLNGVTSCDVNFGTKKATIDYDENSISPSDIAAEVNKYGYVLKFAHNNTNQDTNGKNSELNSARQKVLISLPITCVAVAIMIRMLGGNLNIREKNEVVSVFFHHLLPVLATIMFSVIGRKYLVAIKRYFQYGIANMDTLVGIGTVTAFLYSFIVSAFEKSLSDYIDVNRTFYEAVIIVMGFIEIGKYMEIKVMSKTGKAITALLGLQAKDAIIIKDNLEVKMPIDQVQVGDVMLVKPGEKIPLDGIIQNGSAFIDESMISGEFMPVQKHSQESVIGATIVKDSALYIKATAVGSDTYLSKIIAIVEQAQNSKPNIQKLADRIMQYFVPIVLIIAIGSGLFWLFIGKNIYPDINAIQFAIMSFVGVLVIACPCGLGLATPMAIITGIGHGAKHGILAKNAEGLLKLRKSKYVVFDKTGTLTEGKPKLIDCVQDSDYCLSVLASLESLSNHPIAHAIIEYCKHKNTKVYEVSNFKNREGVGVEGTIENESYIVCNPSYAQLHTISFRTDIIEQRTKEGKTPVMLITQNKVVAYYSVADTIKKSTLVAIKELVNAGIIPVMLTGDHNNTAQYIAKQLGINEIYAELKPEEKAHIISQLKTQGIVTMVGDGINDAPALAIADIGVAMSTGNDIAIESAELTLLHGDLSKLVKAIHISKLTQSAIIQNLMRAFGFNIIGIPLAAGALYPVFGTLLNPAFEGAAMAFSNLTVVGNSLRLQAKKI